MNVLQASENALVEAQALWNESKAVIGGDDEMPLTASRRAGGAGSMQETLQVVQAAFDHDRLQRAQHLLSSASAVDPGNSDIRRFQHLIEVARKNRDKARSEYCLAAEVFVSLLCRWLS